MTGTLYYYNIILKLKLVRRGTRKQRRIPRPSYKKSAKNTLKIQMLLIIILISFITIYIIVLNNNATTVFRYKL